MSDENKPLSIDQMDKKEFAKKKSDGHSYQEDAGKADCAGLREQIAQFKADKKSGKIPKDERWVGDDVSKIGLDPETLEPV